MAIALDSGLLTAEEYGRLPDDGRFTELVRGRVVEFNRPFTSHGFYVNRAGFLLSQWDEGRSLGRVVVGDAGVVTQRNPDSVRGPDVAFYSYERIPRGSLPSGYWPRSPELLIEVLSESDRWKHVLLKVAEYLSADVLTVAVIDPVPRRVHVYSADSEATNFHAGDTLIFPGVLTGFEVHVEKLFE